MCWYAAHLCAGCTQADSCSWCGCLQGGFAAAGNDDEGSAAAPIVTVTPAGIIGQVRHHHNVWWTSRSIVQGLSLRLLATGCAVATPHLIRPALQKTPDSEETLDAFKEGPTLPASPAAVPLPAAPKPEPAANATKVPAPAATKPEPVVAPITSSTPAGVIGQVSGAPSAQSVGCCVAVPLVLPTA